MRSWILGLGPREAPRTNGRLGIGGPIRGSVRRAEVAVGRAELRYRFFFSVEEQSPAAAAELTMVRPWGCGGRAL